jgi:hypothetical protein
MVNFLIFINVIKLKILLCEAVGELSTRDIYNFYYLFTMSSYSPEALKTDYGKFIQEEYLKSFKLKYVSLFKKLLYEQIVKYVERGRIDADFPKEKLSPDASSSVMLELIKKTFRSDMKRRNDVWIMAAEFLQNLESSQYPKDIYIWVDRLNSAVHNTKTAILGKASPELERAYDKVHHAKSIKDYEALVDKNLRQLAHQDIYENMIKLKSLLEGIKLNPDTLKKLDEPAGKPSSAATHQDPPVKDRTPKKDDDKKDVDGHLKLGHLQEAEDFDFYGNKGKKIDATTQAGKSPTPVFKGGKKKKEDDKDDEKKDKHFQLGALQEAFDSAKVSDADRHNVAFMSGLKQAVKDKAAHISDRDLNGYPEDFVRGYKMVKQEGWWDKFNDKLTRWASDFGKSYGQRF